MHDALGKNNWNKIPYTSVNCCKEPGTRKSERRYRFDYTDDNHVELLGILKVLPCPVMGLGYPSRLYDELLSGWHTMAGRNFTDRQRIKRHAALAAVMAVAAEG